MNNATELPPEFEPAIRKLVASRCTMLGLLFGVPSLLALVFGFTMLLEARSQRTELAREVTQLKAEAIRFGQPLEIYNPAHQTVIDGADPKRYPSRDPNDIRRGVLLHQYTPLQNEAQTWVLRPRTTPP